MIKKINIILVLIFMNILLYNLTKMINVQINELYMELYTNMLYDFTFKQKKTLGVLIITFGNVDISLDTYFYHMSINNIDNIKEFLNNLDIKLMEMTISEKEKLYESLLPKYLAHITSMEETFNCNLYMNYNNAKNNTICIIRDFIENFLVLINKNYYTSDYYLEKILNNIDFYSYTKTLDFQSGEYVILKNFYYETIINDIINVSISSNDIHKNENILLYTIKNIIQSILMMSFSLKFILLLPDYILITLYNATVLSRVINILEILHQCGFIKKKDIMIFAKKITYLILTNHDILYAITIICPSTKRLAILVKNMLYGYKVIKYE